MPNSSSTQNAALSTQHSPRTFHIQTLGCKVNHYESDQIAALLRSRGLMPSDSAAQADVRVINTCSVTTQAASQSRQSVRRMVRLPILQPADSDANRSCCPTALSAVEQPASFSQSSTPTKQSKVIVTGCWATSNTAEASALPGVDAVLTHQQNIARELDQLLSLWQSKDSSWNENGRKVEAATPVGRFTNNIEPNRNDVVNGKVAVDADNPSPVDTASTPSPGTLGEGWGEGRENERIDLPSVRLTPHPNPLPAYREREPETTSRSSIGGEVHHGLTVATRESPPSRPFLGLPGATSLPLLNLRQSGRQRAFLKIQDGCDAHCTYCIIPSLRPTLWSKPVDSVVEEATSLVAAGHVEIILTGIFLGAYGQATALRRRQTHSTAKPLGELIEALCTRVPGLRRLRLSSLEPGDLTPELISVLHSHPAVVPHFHLPLQSGSDLLLRRMNRQYTRDDFLQMIDRVKVAFDRPALTTDVVVGFPGETDAEFEKTTEVVRAAGFIHVHAFPYSPRPGTAAARWTKQFVRGPVVNERITVLRQMSEEQSFAFRSTFVGETVEVIVERDTEDRAGETPARHGRCERYFSVTLDRTDLHPGEAVCASISEVMPGRTFATVADANAYGSNLQNRRIAPSFLTR